MNRSFFTLFLLLFFYSNTFSENSNASCIVKGQVMDSVSNVSIPYTTVSVSTPDKPAVYTKRISSGVKGDFELAITNAGNYFLSFESVGMKKLVRSISIGNGINKLDLGKISMSVSEQKLSGVTVVANKPLIKVDLDKISYDTKSDPESKSSNVLEMLKKVPMVTVDGEDNIQLKGSSSFKVYINGKPSGMMTKMHHRH